MKYTTAKTAGGGYDFYIAKYGYQWTLDVLSLQEAGDLKRLTDRSWLPDGYSQIFRSYVFGPLGFWSMAPLRYAAKFDPFLSLDCALHPGAIQGKEGIKFCHLATL